MASLGKLFTDPLGIGLDPKSDLEAFTGQAAAEAQLEGTRLQVEAGREALALLREDLQPFRDLFGPDQMEDLTLLATDQDAQLTFLKDNPLFKGLREQAVDFGFQTGEGAGVPEDVLENDFLVMGNQLINQQINRQLPLLNTAQASAAQAANQSTGLLTGIGNVQAAGGIGAANSLGQGSQNLATAGTALLGAFRR